MKIVDNYHLIVKYIMIIYEGFKEHIDNVYRIQYTLIYYILNNK